MKTNDICMAISKQANTSPMVITTFGLQPEWQMSYHVHLSKYLIKLCSQIISKTDH